MKNFSQKTILSFFLPLRSRGRIVVGVLLAAIMAQQVFVPVAFAQQGGTVLGRAATRAQRIAAASARVAAAEAKLVAAQFAFAAFAPTIITPAEYALRWNKIAEASEELAIATTELQDANTTIQEDILDILDKVLFQSLKKKILDMVVDQIIGYIQGEGEPRFITDWQGFFGDIVQGAVGDLTQALGLGFLCSPFSLPVRLQIAANLTAPVDRFKAKFNCTLDQIVGNIEDFYTDFRNGGWKAYDLAWEPQNNYYGAIWLAWDAEQNIIADRLVSAANEAIANEGWLGVRKCYDRAGNEVDSNYAYTNAAGVNCSIVTPGKALGSLVEKAIGSDIEFIVNSEDLSAYITAITSALFNRVLKEGVGLLGVSTPSAPQRVRTRDEVDNIIYGAGNIPGSTRGAINEYQSSVGEATQQEAGSIQDGSPNSTKFIVLQQLEATQDKRLEAYTFFNLRLRLEENYLAQLRALKNCQDQKEPAKAGATLTKVNDQVLVIEKIEDDITLNSAVLTQLGDSINLIRSMSEAAVVRDLPKMADVLRLLNDFPEASIIRDQTEQELKKAQDTIPSLIVQIGEERRQCLAK